MPKVFNLISLFFILLYTGDVLGQLYVVSSGDTLPYSEEQIVKDGDTTYVSSCHVFERYGDEIINVKDENCKAQGKWIELESNGSKWVGMYKDGSRIGVWKEYNGERLIKEKEVISFSNKKYVVYEAEYDDLGNQVVLANIPVFAFCLRERIPISIFLLVLFLIRVFVNSRLINLENGTNFFPFYIFPSSKKGSPFFHSVLSVFSFWFFKSKPENFRLKIVCNLFSSLFLIFFGFLVFLLLNGSY